MEAEEPLIDHPHLRRASSAGRPFFNQVSLIGMVVSEPRVFKIRGGVNKPVKSGITFWIWIPTRFDPRGLRVRCLAKGPAAAFLMESVRKKSQVAIEGELIRDQFEVEDRRYIFTTVRVKRGFVLPVTSKSAGHNYHVVKRKDAEKRGLHFRKKKEPQAFDEKTVREVLSTEGFTAEEIEILLDESRPS